MADMLLYNGVELPELPDETVWNRETHPYAYVNEMPADAPANPLGINFYMLFVSKQNAVYDGLLFNIGTGLSGNEIKIFVTPKKGVNAGDYEAVRGTWVYYNTMAYAQLDALTWTNTDIEYDGSVVFNATEPQPLSAATPIDPQSMLLGRLMGRQIAGIRKKPEPVAWMYNGVQLPALPELDENKYRAVAIVRWTNKTNGAVYGLIASEWAFVANNANGRITVDDSNGSFGNWPDVLHYDFFEGGADWIAYDGQYAGIGLMTEYSGDYVWSNCNINGYAYVDGTPVLSDTVVHTASEPVQVYE